MITESVHAFLFVEQLYSLLMFARRVIVIGYPPSFLIDPSYSILISSSPIFVERRYRRSKCMICVFSDIMAYFEPAKRSNVVDLICKWCYQSSQHQRPAIEMFGLKWMVRVRATRRKGGTVVGPRPLTFFQCRETDHL